MTTQKIKYLFLSSVSLLISVLFVLAGITIGSDEAPTWIRAYGFLTTGYGIISASLLIIAWTKSQIKVQPFSKYTALIFMASFFAASFDVGMISGLEWLGIVVVGFLLWVQWIAVKSIAKHKMYNEPVHSDAPKGGAWPAR